VVQDRQTIIRDDGEEKSASLSENSAVIRHESIVYQIIRGIKNELRCYLMVGSASEPTRASALSAGGFSKRTHRIVGELFLNAS